MTHKTDEPRIQEETMNESAGNTKATTTVVTLQPATILELTGEPPTPIAGEQPRSEERGGGQRPSKAVEPPAVPSPAVVLGSKAHLAATRASSPEEDVNTRPNDENIKNDARNSSMAERDMEVPMEAAPDDNNLPKVPLVRHSDSTTSTPGAHSIAGFSASNENRNRMAEENSNTTMSPPALEESIAIAIAAHTVEDLEEEVHQKIIAQAPVGEVVKPDKFGKKTKLALAVVALLAVAAIVGGIVVGTQNDDPETETSLLETPQAKEFLTFLEQSAKSMLPSEDETDDANYLSLLDPDSPQFAAYAWMVESTVTYRDATVPYNDTNSRHLLQQYALATLYFSTGGNAIWNITDTHSFLKSEDTCSWLDSPSSALCNDEGIANALHLPDFKLIGTLPVELNYLSSLTVLDVHGNRLFGRLPALHHLKALEKLRLDHNEFTGGLPSAWNGNAKPRLRSLNVGHNVLTGSIIDEIYSLGELESLVLDGNDRLTGIISRSIRSLSNLIVFSASHTGLQDKVPPEFGNCRHLEELRLGGCPSIVGQLPFQIWMLPALRVLDVSDTEIWSNFPTDYMAQMTSLEELHLASCQFQGSIPPELGLLEKLRIFDLSSNPAVLGSLPKEIGLLTNLKVLDVSLNAGIMGAIPSSIGNMTSLEILDVSVTGITESLPTEIGKATRLKEIILTRSQMSTNIPTEIGKLSDLEVFDMMRVAGGTFGTIPTQIGNLKKMKQFVITGGTNGLNGTLPSELASMESLEIVILAKNLLSGTIPSCFGQLESLKMLALDDNRLTGTLPTHLAQLTNLERTFDVSGNAIHGTFPLEYAQWSRLKTIALGGTDLTGEIGPIFCDSPTWPKPYGLYADCSEFDDGCACCTHCCPNTSNKRDCTNNGARADEFDSSLAPGPPGSLGGPSGSVPPGMGDPPP